MDAIADSFVCYISELPDELLVAISSQLYVERGFLADKEAEEKRHRENTVVVRSLHALALSCRKFNAVATPLLYQCIIRSPRRCFVPLLFRTILNNPQLGLHVRYIEFATFHYTEPELRLSDSLAKSDYCKYNERLKEAQWLAPDPESSEELLNNDIDTLSADSARLRVRDLLRLNQFSALSVLLSITENLQDAALPDSHAIVITLAFKRFTHPGKLRRLWLRCVPSSSRGPCSLRMMESNAKELRGHLAHYLRRMYLREPLWLEFEPPPAMRTISLTVQDTDSGYLDDHLRGCASLERLSWCWEWTDQFIPRHAVELPALHKSLRQVRKSLTHLTIDTSESAWRVDINRIIPALGSLREFTALTHLDVAGLVLWGDDDTLEPPPLSSLLPESLETLIINTEWDDDIEDALQQLSVDCAASLPNLKKVDCTWRPAPGFAARYLKDTFHLIGVDLVLDTEDA